MNWRPFFVKVLSIGPILAKVQHFGENKLSSFKHQNTGACFVGPAKMTELLFKFKKA
jgi:hypothetical protein